MRNRSRRISSGCPAAALVAASAVLVALSCGGARNPEQHGAATSAVTIARGAKLAYVVAARDGSASWIEITSPGAEGAKPPSTASGRSGVFDVLPRFSPDGTRVAFVRQVDDEVRALEISELGGVAREIMRLPGAEASFLDLKRWSPDGSSIAFDPYEVVECDTETPFALRLAVAEAESGVLRELSALPRPSTLVFLSELEWAPDGTRLLYVVDWDEEEPEYPGVCRTKPHTTRLYVIRTDGRDRHPVAEGIASQAVWSPDGTQIAYVRCVDDSCALHAVAAGAAGTERTVTEDVPGWMWTSLAWPPPGDEIVHTASDALYASNVRTGELRTIARWRELPDASAAEILAVSSDGRRVAIGHDESARRADRPVTIHIVDVETGAKQTITLRSPTGRFGTPGHDAYGSLAVFLP